MRCVRVLLVSSIVAATSLVGPATRSASAQAPEPSESWTVAPFGRTERDEPRTVLEVDGSVGARRQDLLQFVNRGTEPLVVALAPASVSTPDGRLRYSTPTDVSDPAYWLVLPADAGAITVPPHSAALIPVNVRYPNTAIVGEQLTAVEIADRATGERRHVLVRLRTNGQLRSGLTVERSRLVVSRPTWSPVSPGTAKVTYEVRNTGNVVLRGRFRVQLDTVFDRKVELGRPEEDIVLVPGATLRGEASADVWPTFTMRPEVLIETVEDVPERQRREGAATTRVQVAAGAVGPAVEVIPFAQVVWAAFAFVSLFALWFVARSRARRRLGVEVEV